jgi:hypothetical protein
MEKKEKKYKISEIIKEDLNFLEYPLWQIESQEMKCKKGPKKIIIEKSYGTYILDTIDGFPNHFDKTVLDWILHQAHKKDYRSREIITTRYEIARTLFSGKKKLKQYHYDRVMFALKKWHYIHVNFNGVFYQNGHHITKNFNIINSFMLNHDTSVLSIKIDDGFLQQQRDSSYFVYFDVATFRQIKRPISARLYEVLGKMFLDNKSWAIGLDKLAEKLTIFKRKNAKTYYPSDALPLIKRAVISYNEFAENKIDFLYKKEGNVCIFQKKPDTKKTSAFTPRAAQKTFTSAMKLRDSKQKKETNLAQQMDGCMEQFKALSADEQKKIRDEIKQPFYKILPNEKVRIFTYMNFNKQGSL